MNTLLQGLWNQIFFLISAAVKVGEKRPIEIVTKNTGNPEGSCKVTAVNPKKEPTECPLKKSKEGYETMFAPLEDGPHLVKVEFAGKEIPKSPFKVDVAKLDLSKVDIKGLEKRKHSLVLQWLSQY